MTVSSDNRCMPARQLMAACSLAIPLILAAAAALPMARGASSPAAAGHRKTNNTPPKSNYRPAEIGYVIFVENQPALLTLKLPPLAIHHLTLNQAINRLAVVTGENFAVGWPAVRRAGIKPHIRRNVKLPGASCRRDLARILRVFAPHKRLEISADQNVIFLTTEAEDDKSLILRTYWLPDLLQNLPRIIPPAALLHRLRHPRKNHAHHRNHKRAGYTPGDEKPKAKKLHISTNIITLITNSVRPKIWANHGGNATMTVVGDKVIVDAPSSVQALLNGPKHFNPNAVPRYFMIGL